jgi:UDP-glucose 4-epimerase
VADAVIKAPFPVIGLEGVKKRVTALRSSGNVHLHVEDLSAEGAEVVCRMSSHRTVTTPSGAEVKTQLVEILRIDNGKIAERWVIINRPAPSTSSVELRSRQKESATQACITGTSLVGCSVARNLKEAGHQAVLDDLVPRPDDMSRYAGDVPVEHGDIRDLTVLVQVMQSHGIETIMHTARARFPDRLYNNMRMHTDGAMALVEAARLVQAKRVLCMSTQAVYDFARATGPTPEDGYLAEGENHSVGSKIACERIWRVFARSDQLECAIRRLAQVYGHAAEGAGDVLGVVLQYAITDGLAGRNGELDPGMCDQNDLVSIKDVARGRALAAERPLQHSIDNIGSGRVTGPQELAEAVRGVSPHAKVEVLAESRSGSRWGHTHHLDLHRAREDLGYKPRFDLAQGVADSVQELGLTAPV